MIAFSVGINLLYYLKQIVLQAILLHSLRLVFLLFLCI